MKSRQNYKPANAAIWRGRVDGNTPEYFRWHQIIACIDLEHNNESLQNSLVILGFCSDEGVRRNQGRTGAKDAPGVIRKVLAGLPVHFSKELRLADGGDVTCAGEDLEAAQEELVQKVACILKRGGFPLVLGGGHEVTYAHFKGIKQACDQSVGIINIDAHFDIRKVEDGKGNSGTGFYQIAKDAETRQEAFNYMVIGIQDISNTQALFNYANECAVEIIRASEIHPSNLDRIIDRIREFSKRVGHIYLTIDLDAFAVPYAPGVSAPAFNGIIPDSTFQQLLSVILQLPNLCAVDIAELNPLYDADNRTAKLAADMIFQVAQKF